MGRSHPITKLASPHSMFYAPNGEGARGADRHDPQAARDVMLFSLYL